MADHGGVLYVDTSALVKLVVREAESDAVERELSRWPGAATSTLTDVELGRAILRAQGDRRDLGSAVPLVVLAGFMRILTPGFVTHYAGRLLNIHPSLLPAFPGLHTHERAIAAGVKVHGATVHFVTAELDHGPIVIQAAVPVHADDDAARLADRVLAQEHRIYPQAIRWFLAGQLDITDGRVHVNDGSAQTVFDA